MLAVIVGLEEVGSGSFGSKPVATSGAMSCPLTKCSGRPVLYKIAVKKSGKGAATGLACSCWPEAAARGTEAAAATDHHPQS